MNLNLAVLFSLTTEITEVSLDCLTNPFGKSVCYASDGSNGEDGATESLSKCPFHFPCLLTRL